MRENLIEVSFTELRNKAKKFFDKVERGASLQVYRHGRPMALILPLRQAGPRWRTASPLRIKAKKTVSQMIIDDRG